jgi:hypothetical protein
MITEYMAKGDLRRVLQNEPDLPWNRKLKMALDAAEWSVT